MMKKTFVFACVFLALALPLWSQSDTAEQANRRTALRCLSLAKEYASSHSWQAVESLASQGIAYDSTISDLYYMLAAAKNALGDSKAEILPLVQTALTTGDWVDYNRDSARVLYADLLCDTGSYASVPAILDASPLIYSADAEYIRAKAYYRMATVDSVSKARAKIDSARKIYPLDTRFPLLFYKSESPQSINAEVRRLADFFFTKISQYAAAAPDKDTELEIYAALFARGEEQKRMLQSFNARGLRHPLYAGAALQQGLLSQREALDYIRSFADVEIDWNTLKAFVPLITETEVKAAANTYFTAFEGMLTVDSDNDGIVNMYIKYYRGRPENIMYDKNQDGIIDWQIIADFGVPIHAKIPPSGLEVDWDTYPYLSSAVYQNASRDTKLTFSLVRDEVLWSPISISIDQVIAANTGAEFYFPSLIPDAEPVTDDLLMTACYEYTMPSKEREGASVTFTVLDGKLQFANYAAGGVTYAHTQFIDGFPYTRRVDANGDGTFETTEVYGYDYEGTMAVHCLEDEESVMTNLFGTPGSGSGFFLSFIQIDSNGDTIPEFIEEYLPHEGKITSWDLDADGLWDIRSTRYPRKTNTFGEKEPLIEEAQFYVQTQKQLVTVTSVDGVPIAVENGNGQSLITREGTSRLYWIDTPGSQKLAQEAIRQLDATGSQGVSMIVHYSGEQALAVRVGNNYYATLVPVYSFDDEE